MWRVLMETHLHDNLVQLITTHIFRKLFGPAHTSYFTHIIPPNVNITCTYTHPSGPPVKLDNTLAPQYLVIQHPAATITNQNHMKENSSTTWTVKVCIWCLVTLIFLTFIWKKVNFWCF